MTPKTIYDWMARHPEFDDAVKRAQAKSALWWERRILDLAQNDQGNARAVGLKNRVGDHWRDRVETEVSGGAGRITRIVRVIVRPGEVGG